MRNLWTDAFAVCNFLGLHRATGEALHLARARALVDVVHEGLGRHRLDAHSTAGSAASPSTKAAGTRRAPPCASAGPSRKRACVHIVGQEQFEDRSAARMSREIKWLGLHHEVP